MKFFSTFTGIGGLDCGLEAIGAECVGFSEIKESSIRIYQRHFPGRKCFGDITKIDPAGLPDFDVLTGGFPCQSFSLSGMRKGFEDRRGKMIFYLFDILTAKQPEFFVLENVKGILSHDGGATYENVFKLLTAAGYSVRALLLNSAFYGSAQNRERILFLGRRGAEEKFPLKNPEAVDATKRFRDFRDSVGPFKFLSANAIKRLYEGRGRFQLIGGYDRIGTLTTGISSSGRALCVTQEPDGNLRYLTETEGERLQGFPDGWTEGESRADRCFAIGNAVNCNVSRYLFGNYLKGLWW